MSKTPGLDKIGDNTNLDMMCEIEKRKMEIIKLQSPEHETLSDEKMHQMIKLMENKFDFFEKMNVPQFQQLYNYDGAGEEIKQKLIQQLNGRTLNGLINCA